MRTIPRRSTAKLDCLLCLALLLGFPIPRAQAAAHYLPIKSFGFPNLTSQNPFGSLIEGSDGALYGRAYNGGANKRGTAFKMNKDGSGQVILHDFNDASSDVENPQARLLLFGTNGWLYGTTAVGGSANQGTVFGMRADGSGYTDLYDFGMAPGDGLTPWAGLIQASDGALYGTTVGGGSAGGSGTVFKLNPDGSGYAVLHSFNFAAHDGAAPQASLLEGTDGALYGVASSGGTNNAGVVFKLNKDGTGYNILHNFRQGNGDGWDPQSGLLEGSDRALYGTTPNGGTNNRGTIFRINEDGTGYTILHSLTGSLGVTTHMVGPLLEDSGALYGTTSAGGSNNVGTVFKLNLDGSGFAVLRQFSTSGDDGSSPQAGLLLASDGAVYGSTFLGGAGNKGTIFKLQTDGSQYGVIASFSASAGDGAGPEGVVFGTNGLLYGTTRFGGGTGLGTVFMVSTAGSYEVLHSFSGTNGDGSTPEGSAMLASDGVLYGTTALGGSNKAGVLFRLNQDGTGYQVMYSFGATNGDVKNPEAGLIEGSDGQLYGTSWYGGSTGNGTVFKFSRDFTTYSIVHSFTGADGSGLWTRVIQGSDSVIYGTAYGGGTNGYGTVFKVNPDGSGFAVLHYFSAGKGPDGANPAAELLEGSDGFLYGTTTAGGTNSPSGGTIFKLSRDGTEYALLSNFGASGLTEGLDGALYGTSQGGSVFMMNKDGTGFTVLEDLTGLNGKAPASQLVRQANGVFFGTTFGGGDLGQGVVFELLPPETPDMLGSIFSSGNAEVIFSGVGGYQYALARSYDLISWIQLGTNAMPSTGISTNTDHSAGAAFYRAEWLP